MAGSASEVLYIGHRFFFCQPAIGGYSHVASYVINNCYPRVGQFRLSFQVRTRKNSENFCPMSNFYLVG